MRFDKFGKTIKNRAPQWMRRNTAFVAIYDRIFEKNGEQPRARGQYLSLVPEAFTHRDWMNGHLHFSSLFNGDLSSDAVLFFPGYIKFSLFQMQSEAVCFGRELVLTIGQDANAQLLKSVAFSLGISTDHNSGDTFVSTRPMTAQSSPYDSEASEEAWLRSLQFVAGLRSRRSTLILMGDQTCSVDIKLWNTIVRNILKVSNKFDGNILIVENSTSNNLTDANYAEILGRDNVALLPGALISSALVERLERSTSVAPYLDDSWKRLPAALPQMVLRDLHRRQSQKNTFEKNHNLDLAGEYSRIFVRSVLPGPLSLAQSEASVEVINGVQRYIVDAFDASGRLDGASATETLPSISSSSAFLQWGASESKRRKRLRRNSKNSAAPLFFVEDGFIRSVEIGLRGSPGLSFLVDDLAPYYEAREWSRIELTLASEWNISNEQIAEARACIDDIKARRISKYNHAPDYAPSWQADPRRKILLVDQRNGDQSVSSGLASADTFREMVSDATSMEKSLVILKRHPDATIGNMGSYFSAGNLGPLLSHPSVAFHDDEINPYSLFDAVDEVWCVTSGMGFEALIAGKKVKVYGAPFYAGWGLTEDRLRLDWRSKTPRTLEEIFYCAYLARSVYFNERTGMKCGLAELVAQVAIDRDQYLSKGHQ